MDFINIIKDKAEEATNTVVKFSGEVVEVTKIRFAMMDAESQINTLTREIGELVYRSSVEEGDLGEEIEQKCGQITKLKQQIEAYKAKVNELKNVTICKNCGSKLPNDYTFCPNCGEQNRPTDDNSDAQ